MGYTNVVVYASGNVEWDSRYISWTIEDITPSEPAPEVVREAPPAPAPVSDIKEGPFEGSIDNDFFVELMATNPESIQLIDVRSQQEFGSGHILSSINMTVDQLQENIDSFTDEKPIVFICSTGARSGEAYYLFLDRRPDLQNVYYVDADVSFTPDGSFTIE
ncbi:rhodanese-like domain-containing protein [Desulfonatronovibrio hydrogenovorans]|uniref:rhodanese-like domain-containing protein n=1 Tax=Desulfonatronovibrio hydrogenovorans TaxID=53245 RepID=UPI0004916F6E|nr:rhodanese-like domain-containing protein [Desulfonatronovibrio hydrogenovorans]